MVNNTKSEHNITFLSKNITEFLNVDYLNFSISTVSERAIPSLCDGLKPGARKILNAAFVGSLKDGKTYKMLSLVGDTMNKSLFSHGDASLIGTCCTLAKNFLNYYNPIEIEGQGGILRDPSAGAPRYLYIRKSKWADALYKIDYDLLKFVEEEGQAVEPEQYYPIVPNILSNLTMGIANGYSFHCMSWNPLDVVKYCINVLNGNDKYTEQTIKPYLKDIKSHNWRYVDGSWYCYGEWLFEPKKDVMVVTDLPADMTYIDFEKILNKLCESGYIKDYQNLSEDGKVLYRIYFPKKGLETEFRKDPDGERIISKLKLVKQVPSDLLWVLDENSKLKYFDNRYELAKYFVNWRLKIYEQRKSKLVSILENHYKENSKLVKFIELVCKGKLKIRNRSKNDIQLDMKAEDLPMSLIQTPMSKVTIEERDALLKENEDIKNELDYIKNTTTKQMYINDLNNLKKTIEKDFK